MVWNVDINAEIAVLEISVITLMEAVHMDVRMDGLVLNVTKVRYGYSFLLLASYCSYSIKYMKRFFCTDCS